jgi:hypothetical protein
VQGIDRYIWLVGQIITEPSVKQLLSKDRGLEPSVDQEFAEPRTPEFSGYVSSEVTMPRFSLHFVPITVQVGCMGYCELYRIRRCLNTSVMNHFVHLMYALFLPHMNRCFSASYAQFPAR